MFVLGFKSFRLFGTEKLYCFSEADHILGY